jgi:hypothetical protein
MRSGPRWLSGALMYRFILIKASDLIMFGRSASLCYSLFGIVTMIKGI